MMLTAYCSHAEPGLQEEAQDRTRQGEDSMALHSDPRLMLSVWSAKRSPSGLRRFQAIRLEGG
jgi:hypothetical protein